MSGRRCADHVGELHPARCAACELLNAPRPRIGYHPGTECPKHAEYPLPCDRCERDAEEGIR